MIDLVVNNVFDFKTARSESKFSLKHYRFFSLLGLITYPAFYYVMKISVANADDYLSLRLIIAAMCVVCFVSTFFDNWIKRHLDLMALIIILTGAFHSIFLLAVNQFQSEYFIDFCITTIIFCFAVKKRINLSIFLLSSFTCFFIVLLINRPLGEALYSNLTVAVLYGAVFMILSNKMLLENEVSLGSSLMESLFEDSPSGILFIDRTDDRIVKVNSKTVAMLGAADKEAINGESFRKLTGHDYLQTLGTGYEIELTNFTGGKFWADITWQKISMNNGNYTVVRLTDITEKKKTENELLAKDEMLHGVAEASRTLLLRKDFNNAIKLALQTIGKSAGVDRVYMYENSVNENDQNCFSHRYEWIRESNAFRINLQRLQHLTYETHFPRWYQELSKGKTIKGNVEDFANEERAVLQSKGAHSVMIVPIFIDDHFNGFLGFEHRSGNHVWNQNEESILRMASAVVSGAFFRQKVEKELIEAKQTAEASSKAKESFLANVSHEIRTPMNGIIGLTQLLYKSVMDAKQKQYITAIKQSSEHLLVIINDLLDFSKIVAGQIEFEKIEFDLNGLIYNINQTYGNRALEKGIQLKIDINENVPQKLVGDPVRLNQVLVNLIGNAIKFTERGNVTLKIKDIEDKSAKCRLQFTIEDTGIGIPEDKLESIFESFKQASTETARKYGGTGLGLGIVKKLLDAQDGKIQVESILNKGSRFMFDLVFEKFEAGTNVNQSIKKEAYHSLNHVRILLAEDNVVNQLLANDLISDWGAIIDIADNGEIAINKLRQHTYDLILMDVQMPVLNGLEATEIIRKYCEAPINKTPIIAMTANAIKGDNEKYLSIGMNDYITKPFDALNLNQKIWQYLSPEKRKLAEQISGNEKTIAPVDQEFTSTLIDLSNLKEFSRGKTDFVIKMLTLLVEQTPPAVAEMGKGIETGDWQIVRALAHKMKPNVSLLGNADLDAIILKIEKNAESLNRLDSMPETYGRFRELLDPAMDETQRALRFYREKK